MGNTDVGVNKPLSGVRVVELAGMGSVPFAGMMLADLGADIVQVDRPATTTATSLTDLASPEPSQDFMNRGRRCVALNLQAPPERHAFVDLASCADVLIEGFRPGTMERLAVGPKVLLDKNPRLVFARVSGYGQSGPFSDRAGHDINYLAMSGALAALAKSDTSPSPPLNLVADYGGGGMGAVVGILARLIHARVSGSGGIVDVSMTDATAFLTSRLHSYRVAPRWPRSAKSDFPLLNGDAPYYTTYRCSDDRFLAVGAIEDKFYARFVSGLGLELSLLPSRDDMDQWSSLTQVFAAIIGSHDRAFWVDRFADTDACVTPVLELDEVSAHALHTSRGAFVVGEQTTYPAPPVRFSTTDVPLAAGAACQVDVEQVLAEWQAS